MSMRTLISSTLLGLTLCVAGCSGQDAGKTDKKQAAKSTKGDAGAKADGGEVAGDDGAAPEDEAPALDPKVEKAVTVANKIAAEPEKADSILEEAGMDRTQFESLLYEIAKDPALSESYAAVGACRASASRATA